ncbi:RdgB/HAM1 family non-canonical purine NTP pyrophosphatase [uncultured Psychrobacter sp.]|uniref:RdgB/HAM1 family non-canonical purine NTP pyrophosphatase n=1 Tax=uncultured Psychrobacter sp. TaxID=259303 RepID=UPI0034579E34
MSKAIFQSNNQQYRQHQQQTLFQNKWILASNNQGKLAEFKRLFAEADLNVTIIPQGELNIEDAIEDGLSFVENAIIKARHASRIGGLPAIADDSGLCVPILGNAPGIHSARYAGEHGNDSKNNAKLIEELQPLRMQKPDQPIKGMFVCVLAMVRHANDPLPIIAQGLWQGEILEAPQGDNGFGYDPLFWLPELQTTAASMDAADKNRISHRGQAIGQLLSQLLS